LFEEPIRRSGWALDAIMSLYDIPVRTITGEESTLEPYRGRVVLVVNVASKCGFTPQYEGLETLYRKHKDAGLVVLGFPCNQFLWEEPGDETAIRSFCSTKYAVTFPMFAKVDVNGPTTHPLYQYLKSRKRGLLGTRAVKWNFTKFLVDRRGEVVGRYSMFARPDRIEPRILTLLGDAASAPVPPRP
jgi:glutathione peroxidase